MKNIGHWLKSIGIMLLGLLLMFSVCIAIIYFSIRWEIESWPIFVSILAGAGLFFAIYKSFGEFKKIK